MKYHTHRNAQSDSEPKNTRKAAKRRKMNKPKGNRRSNPITLIYRKGTDCEIADEATEKRLKSRGPSTSTRNSETQLLW